MRPEPIAAYLAELRRLLRGSPRDNARLVSELEGHLRDAVAAACAKGMSPEDAAEVAIARVGPAARIASEAAVQVRAPSLAVRVAVRAVRLGAVVLVALGLNGLLGEAISRFTGMDFYFGDERTQAVSPERCAQLLKLQPGQSTCNGALVEHHFGEYVVSGFMALVVGALLLWGVRAWSFRYEPVGRQRRALELATGLAAVVQFSLLAVTRLPVGLIGALRNPNLGAGRALSEGTVCAVAAVLCAVLAVRVARRSAESEAAAL